MKKIYILIAALFATVQLSQAQYRLAKGDKQLNIAAGGSTYGTAAGFLGTIGMDFGIHKDISIGGELSVRALTDALSSPYYNGYNYSSYSYGRPYTVFGISGNGNYHFNSLIGIPTKWDLYAGANVGVFIVSSPSYIYDPYYGYTTPSATYVRPGIGLQTGGRYYFTNKAAILGEIGFTNVISLNTMAYFKFGVSLAF